MKQNSTKQIPKKVVCLVGHGSRHNDANVEFEELVASVRNDIDYPLYHGYIELASPAYPEVLESLSKSYDEIIIVPIALFMAGHVKNDIPLAIAQLKKKYPDVTYSVTPALGVQTELANLFSERIQDLEGHSTDEACIIVVGRGSSDPDANSDFFKMARLIGESAGIEQVLPTYIGITSPTLPDTLEYASRLRPKSIVVVPYFLFTGVLIRRIQDMIDDIPKSYPWLKARLVDYIGVNNHLRDLIVRRIHEAEQGALPLACVTCKYRAPLGQVTEHVGGLKSLLWSIRHTVTHNQAMPHDHAHTPMKKHVLVCTNNDCADKGALRVLRRIQRTLKDKKVFRDFKVTRTSCMGRCGEGPTVAVYPDGIWYRELNEDDGQALVEEHLLNDKLVTAKVDNIMQ